MTRVRVPLSPPAFAHLRMACAAARWASAGQANHGEWPEPHARHAPGGVGRLDGLTLQQASDEQGVRRTSPAMLDAAARMISGVGVVMPASCRYQDGVQTVANRRRTAGRDLTASRRLELAGQRSNMIRPDTAATSENESAQLLPVMRLPDQFSRRDQVDELPVR